MNKFRFKENSGHGEPRYLSRYSDWATDWTSEESWFDSRQGQYIFLYFIAPGRAVGSRQPAVVTGVFLSGGKAAGV
jgi:hypothetical protein